MRCGEKQYRRLGVMVAGAAALALMVPAASAVAASSVCIPAYQIDHTQVLKNNTILFFMHGRKIWQVPIVSTCSTLYPSTRGFTYEPTDPGSDEICSNLVTIHVNDTHETCLLGAFTPYVGPKSAEATP